MIRSQLEGADAHHTFRVDSAGEGHLRVPKPEGTPPSWAWNERYIFDV